MSMIQSIIGTAAGAAAPALTYPVPGSFYPYAEATVSGGGSRTTTGYYEWPLFMNTNPTVGLWRRTYTPMALDGTNFDSNFPGSYTQVQSMLDSPVGFGQQTDSATQYTMEWLGYFVPSVTGDFHFRSMVDDYMFMWLGQTAVSGFNNTNYVLKDSMSTVDSTPLTAGRYYPVRIRYTEIAGGNSMAIAFGLNGTILRNNLNSTSGQFYTDDRTNAGGFPVTGLIV